MQNTLSAMPVVWLTHCICVQVERYDGLLLSVCGPAMPQQRMLEAQMGLTIHNAGFGKQLASRHQDCSGSWMGVCGPTNQRQLRRQQLARDHCWLDPDGTTLPSWVKVKGGLHPLPVADCCY